MNENEILGLAWITLLAVGVVVLMVTNHLWLLGSLALVSLAAMAFAAT